MTRKQRRVVLIVSCLAVIGLAAGLVLYALNDTLVFFRTPSDVTAEKVEPGQRFRLGGLVADGSVERGQGTSVSFAVTDTLETLAVRYDGILPDLFREGQGVVAEGRINEAGVFVADTVLAKHDENYMPREVADALKKTGQWKGPDAQ